MRYSQIRQSCITQFLAPRGNEVIPFILGAPGGGKSACARDIARSVLTKLGIEPVTYNSGDPTTHSRANIIEFTASLRDPVDILGTPNNTGDCTRWIPPEEYYAIRKGRGPCFLIGEELSDAPVPMQNAMCAVIYDKRAGSLQLSDELFIIATGNRTEDKSGANRITSKLAGRTRRFDFTENIDDWTEWALANDIPTELIQFLRFRPGLLSEFDPNRFANPTPRTWEKVALIPDKLDDQLFYDNAAGDVGEGAAAEYTGFRKIFRSLPNIDALLLDPAGAEVPSDPAVLFAVTGALARKSTADNFSRIATYTARLPREFDVMTTKDAVKLCPDIKHTRAFSEWAARNAEVVL